MKKILQEIQEGKFAGMDPENRAGRPVFNASVAAKPNTPSKKSDRYCAA